MINVFRLHQKKLMIVITILTIVAFAWLYNPSKLEDLNANHAYTVYGKTLTQADVQRQANRFMLARDLGQIDLIAGLSGMAPSEDQMVDAFVWNLYVLQHEARELGIEPTDTQVVDRIRSLPVFQNGGQFDPAKYVAFVEEKLGPRGFTEKQIEDVIKDALRLDALRAVITSPAAVSAADVTEAARILQKVDVQTISFPLEAARAGVVVPEEEIAAFFKQNQDSPHLVAPETRVVEFVKFALPGDGKTDEKAAAMEALQKLANAAVDFSTKAAGGDFAQAAAAAGLTVGRTPEFDRSGASRGTAAADQPSLVSFAPAAFLLSDQQSVSDPVQDGNAFYVLKLVSANPQRRLTLEEVRPIAQAQLGMAKAQGIVRKNADAALVTIRAAMAAGKSFADAATEAGLKVEAVNGVSPADATPAQMAALHATLTMEPGQISGFLPARTGGSVVYLASRAPLDAAEFSKQKAEFEQGLLENKREMLFVSWLVSAREAAKIGQIGRRQ